MIRTTRGFSLLEVILALGILVGAMAVLGELARHGLDSARIARDSAMAQLLCESKLSEITAGLIRPEPVSNVPFGTTSARARSTGSTRSSWPRPPTRD